MSSSVGRIFKVSIFGESHGAAVGAVIDGVPAGIAVDMDDILLDMARRAPRNVPGSTARREPDIPRVLSGIYGGVTTGSPIAVMIENTDMRSRDYERTSSIARPGHADITARARYGGHADMRGGGHFSGRLTAGLVFAGGIARQLLRREGVTVGSRIKSIGGISDESIFEPDAAALDRLRKMDIPVAGGAAKEAMKAEIEAARSDADSVGGVIETFALGLPMGVGDPIWGGIEPVIAAAVFGVPGVKGVEFGEGFRLSAMRGSGANDAMRVKDGRTVFVTNNCGGILGGISTGAPLVVRTAMKPTASIGRPQASVDMDDGRDAELVIHGRHDSCIAVRGTAAVEAAVLVSLADLMLTGKAEETY